MILSSSWLAWAAHVHVLGAVVEDARALPEEIVDVAGDGVLVAGDGGSGEHDGVALGNADVAVRAVRHARQGARGLTLAARRDDGKAGRGGLPHLVDTHDRSRGRVEVLELAGHGDVVDHRAARDEHLAAREDGGVDHLLGARDERGEGRHDDAAIGVDHDVAEGFAHELLAGRVPLDLGVGGVGQQEQAALAPHLPKAGEVGVLVHHGGVVDLEVARVHDGSKGRADDEPAGIGNAVGDGEELNLEGARLHALARLHLAQRLGGELVLLKLHAHEPLGEARAVNGRAEVAAEVGERAYVVLVAVRQEHGAQLLRVGPQVGEVGDDEVDA